MPVVFEIKNNKKSGFTIIELLVVISIIGILSTIGVVSFSRVQANSRDSQRSSKITVIAEALEKYYGNNGEYPSCVNMSQSAATVSSSTLTGMDPKVLATPTATTGSNSILPSCADLVAGSTTDAFAYIGDASAGCLTGIDCSYYTLKYREESTGNIITIASRRNNDNTINVPTAPTVAANTVGTTTTYTWNNTCLAGTTARYQYTYYTNAGYNSGWVATASTSFVATTSSEGYTYSLFTQTQCYSANTTSVWSASSNTASYYRPITQHTLTITAGSNGTVNAGGTYNTGNIKTITATPNANYAFSSWSGSTGCSGVASHTITMDADKSCTANFTIITYALTITAGAGGTVSSGGTYNSGSTPTITATHNANSNYAFSSWSGSTGCSGVASHTITMDADKSCTANFITLDANWLAIGTQVWAKANLNVGTRIAGASAQTNNSSLEKYCYNDLESNCTANGGSYSWDEAMQYVTTAGAQGICSTGSHIPTDNDIKILEVQLGMSQAQADMVDTWRGTDQGTQLKSGGSSGLNIPLAGQRNSGSAFSRLGSSAALWSSSASGALAWYRYLDVGLGTVSRSRDIKENGFSVRCVGN